MSSNGYKIIRIPKKYDLAMFWDQRATKTTPEDRKNGTKKTIQNIACTNMYNETSENRFILIKWKYDLGGF